MTTVGTLYSSAARTTALDSIGGNSFDSTIPGLLQQAIVAVGNNGGGGGGSTAWGAITGTLSNQTDLQTALNAKVALTGDTMTGLLQFTGTTHAGIRLNNLTTVERDAIASPQAGMTIWNTTAARLQLHNGSAWTAGMVRLDGDTMTGALTIGVGTNSPTSAAGLALTNATAATAGVQSASPLLTLTGQGWKTTATAASQSVAFLTSVLPVQGTTAPTGSWRLQSSINGATAIDRLTLNTSVGTLTLGSTSGSNSTAFVIQGTDRSGTLTLSAFASCLAATTGLDIQGNNAILRMVDAAISTRFGSLNGIADAHLGFISLTATAQKVSVYRLATDASNYERLALSSSAGVFSITCETAGTGADDIDLTLTPAGTGNVRFGTHSAVGVELVTGFITIKDAGGTSRKLAVIS
jgi:hypothetical protein